MPQGGMRLNILSLCDHSGIFLESWARNGHYTRKVDLANVPSEDIRYWRPDRHYDIVAAFPPCTHLAGSGARHWAKKGIWALVNGVELVYHCLRIIHEARAPIWFIENPVGRLSTVWRKPNYIFDPHHYAPDRYSKKTCLWTSSNFVMPPRTQWLKHDEIDFKFIYYMGKRRGRDGSKTPRRIPLAFYKTYCNYVVHRKTGQTNIDDFVSETI